MSMALVSVMGPFYWPWSMNGAHFLMRGVSIAGGEAVSAIAHK